MKRRALEQEKKSSFDTDYICSFQGPILFTAPHSVRLYRGGKDWEDERRMHQREVFTSTFAMRCANELSKHLKSKQKGSFCIWNRDAPLTSSKLDPNYLMRKHLPDSSFHCALHRFVSEFPDQPLLHVDLHGKVDRKDNLEIDLGIAPMEEEWDERGLVKEIKQTMKQELDETFKTALAKIKPKCNPNPFLHALWGYDDLFTISHQSIAFLNLPAFQLEIPRTVRRFLSRNESMFGGFLRAIALTYDEVIAPWWKEKAWKCRYNEKLAEKVKDYKFTEAKLSSMVAHYDKCEWASKDRRI